MSLKTYKDFADNDYNYITNGKTLMESYPSKGVVEAQQVVEKYLKSILQERGEKVLKTHDLVNLYKAIGCDLGIGEEELSWLARFYFIARYQGEEDDEIIVDNNDLEKAVQLVEKVRNAYYSYKWKENKEESKEDVNGLTVPAALSDLLAKASIS